MTRRLILGAGGVLALMALLLLVDIFRPGLLWRSPQKFVSPETKKLQEIAASYEFGAEQARGGMGANKICLGVHGVKLSACLQGFFFTSQSRSIEVENLLDGSSYLDESLPKSLTPVSKYVWYASLGMALAQNAISPIVIKSRIMKTDFFNYVIDGWAFISVSRVSLLPTLDSCRKLFKGEQLRACLFGAGRATYYSPDELAQLNREIPQDLVFGYLFAKGFSLETNAGPISSPALRLAEQAVAAWGGQSPDSCVSTKYILRCLSGTNKK